MRKFAEFGSWGRSVGRSTAKELRKIGVSIRRNQYLVERETSKGRAFQVFTSKHKFKGTYYEKINSDRTIDLVEGHSPDEVYDSPRELGGFAD